jgi:hypothetical protein
VVVDVTQDRGGGGREGYVAPCCYLRWVDC